MSITTARRIRHAVAAALDPLELLEQRCLLANDPLAITRPYVAGAYWLNVAGTANDDAIVVTRTSATSYTIANGSWSTVRTGTFTGIRVAAGAGNDAVTIAGWMARSSVLGEAGDDTLVGGASIDALLGGVGNDSVAGNGGNDSLYGEIGNDTLVGGVGNDIVHGGANDDSLEGSDGNDVVSGIDGNDVLSGGIGNDSLNGGIGNDLVNAGDGSDTLLGDAGNDSLNGDAGNDVFIAGAGDDSVDGGADNDRVVAHLDTGNDVYVGGSGLDQLDYTGRVIGVTITLDDQQNDGAPGETDDVSADLESITGGNGHDSITGNLGDNVLYGGLGNDTINGGDGNDKVYGGGGHDSLSGGNGDDSVIGQGENDKLFGNDGEDLLEGSAGNDVSDGGAGRDRLIGIGGGVYDTLTGGDGLDSFWLDYGVTEVIVDLSAEETAARAEHRVRSFVNCGATPISKEIAGQKLPEPIGSGKVVNYRANKLFADAGPSMNDIRQGQVGDCWYLATLSAIAKVSPETIRQSITDLGDGTYAARFNNPSTGVEQYVRIDADLCTYTWSNTVQIYATSGAEGSIWAPMLEKALTWVRGSRLGNYATISSGWMNEAASRMGLSSINASPWSTGSVNGMVDWLRTQLDANRAVTIGTPGVQPGVNLVGGHAYAIDRVNDNGDGTFDIVLRNPWASDGYACTDGVNDGYVTIPAAHLFGNCSGITSTAA